VLFALSLCFVMSLVSLSAVAQEQGEDRATSFQAVQGAQHEDVPGGKLLVGAYAVVLVLLVGYVARLGMMHQKTASEVERLSRLLESQRKA
jgi:CcmD family protein